ncbi:AraC-like DNA-binding protein [Pedobacter sp. UYEF25]
MAKAHGEKNGVKRIAIILQILYKLAQSKEFIILETQNIYENIIPIERDKINKLRSYIVENFTDTISVEIAANLIGMTTFAFCKYFKKLTRKTFVETVIDYCINHAINQLLNSDKSISEIAYGSGFNDLSNFHKTFKRKKKCSPLTYKKTLFNKEEFSYLGD